MVQSDAYRLFLKGHWKRGRRCVARASIPSHLQGTETREDVGAFTVFISSHEIELSPGLGDILPHQDKGVVALH